MYPIKIKNNRLGRSIIFKILDEDNFDLTNNTVFDFKEKDGGIAYHLLKDLAFPDIDKSYRVTFFSLVFDSPFNLIEELHVSPTEEVFLFMFIGKYTIKIQDKTFYKISNLLQAEGLGINSGESVICTSESTRSNLKYPFQGIAIVGESISSNPTFIKSNKWSAYYSFKPEKNNYMKVYKDYKFFDDRICTLNKKSKTTIVIWDEQNFWVYPQLYNRFISNHVKAWSHYDINIVAYLPADDPKSSGLLGIPGLTNNLFESAEFFTDIIKNELPYTEKIIFSGNCVGGYAPIIFSHLTNNNSISFNFTAYPVSTFMLRYKNLIPEDTLNLPTFFKTHYNINTKNTCIMNFRLGDEEFRQFQKFIINITAEKLNTLELYSNPVMDIENDAIVSFMNNELPITPSVILED